MLLQQQKKEKRKYVFTYTRACVPCDVIFDYVPHIFIFVSSTPQMFSMIANKNFFIQCDFFFHVTQA